MGNQALLFLCLLALFFLQSNTLASKAAGFEASLEHSYDPCSPLGPQHWGTLQESWAMCASRPEGMQSPISIKPSNIHNTHLGKLLKYYTEAPARLLNMGHEIMVSWTESPGVLLLNGKIFHLRQCHWHTPSEHELFGIRYPLELHIVHTTSESTPKKAVIGVLFEYGGKADPFLGKLGGALNELNELNVTSLDVGSIYPPVVGDEETYFRYNGSVTSPPCSEPVIWTVMKEVRSVTEEQVELLRAPVNHTDNARPTQPLNGRKVYFSDPFYEQKEEGNASS
ncbi:dioscorin DB3S-like [Zingiber officinale]|uniref:dioscorin DB3S-like n=1 Tax=Zingiber officinale TaxID=94328 RepID=UPI001C4C8EE0|nr:dioscorin DB3S-like [Zingiber officinale]